MHTHVKGKVMSTTCEIDGKIRYQVSVAINYTFYKNVRVN